MEIDTSHIKSVPATFMEKATQRGDKIAMRHKEFGLWREVSWAEYLQESVKLAHGLMDLGLQHGEYVGIIGENCPEWLYMDMGVQMAGGRTVGIYTTSPWRQVQYVLKHSGCKILFAENEEQVDKWLHMREDLPDLKYVIYWDKKGLERMHDDQLLFYDDFMARGEEARKRSPDQHLERMEKVKPDDVSLLIYTSGTTGNPKGAMVTGKGLLWMAEQIGKEKYGLINKNDNTISFLPLCHIFERMYGVYVHILTGFKVNFVESLDTIAQNMTEIRPTIGYGVPRVWEKFQSTIMLKVADAPLVNRMIFKAALKIGERYAEKTINKEKVSPGLAALRFLAYWTVLYPIRYLTGMNRFRYAISGAAPISPRVLMFYHALGINMTEIYGMTETTGLITSSLTNRFKLGTVGFTLDDFEIKISEDGEIMTRHPGVIPGYYKNPEATKETMRDGWLLTGDVGELDDEGFLTLLDRKKDIIITAGGKNIAPQKIESMLKVSIYVNDAIVIGDQRKYLTAIIVLDEENINKYARDQKIQYTAYSELANHVEIKKLIDREVQQVNRELSNVETLKKYTILDKRLYVEDGEVTPTMKVKRKFISEEYKEIIENMYI